VAYGGGIFAAVGSGGVIVTSPTGSTWTARTSGTTSTLNSVAYGNGTFVAVGDAGTVLTSSTGTTWTKVSGLAVPFIGITYGNNLFVAVGAGGAVYSSSSGSSWTQESSITVNNLRGIAYFAGEYIAVGDNGTILQTVENTPPTGSVSINNGAATTNTTAVTLYLSATDNSGTVSSMQFSNDNISWTSPQSYAVSAPWTLPAGDGVKTVYARFMDKNGNWSSVYNATITLSTPKVLTVNVTGTGTVTGSGISCTGTGCTQTYPAGTSVPLYATTSADYLFSGWSGACTGTGDCTVTMNSNTTVNATFTYVQPAKIMGTANYFATLQGAYNAAQTGNAIQAREFFFSENVLLNLGTSVFLAGGYDTGYATPIGVSTIAGSLTVGTGSVTIQNVVIQ
jgi:hypothetical protein